MKFRKPSHVLWISSAFFLTAVALQVLIDPLSLFFNVVRVARIRTELPRAMARWQASNISDYEIDVDASIPLACWSRATLTVRQDKLYAVRAAEGLPLQGTSEIKVPIETQAWDGYCAYRNWTVRQIFQQVQKNLEQIDTSNKAVIVEFDPQYGYVTHLVYRDGYRMGLLTPVIGECCVEYRFSNFQPGNTSPALQPSGADYSCALRSR